jgi:nickel-dependent lactate racemase
MFFVSNYTKPDDKIGLQKLIEEVTRNPITCETKIVASELSHDTLISKSVNVIRWIDGPISQQLLIEIANEVNCPIVAIVDYTTPSPYLSKDAKSVAEVYVIHQPLGKISALLYAGVSWAKDYKKVA